MSDAKEDDTLSGRSPVEVGKSPAEPVGVRNTSKNLSLKELVDKLPKERLESASTSAAAPAAPAAPAAVPAAEPSASAPVPAAPAAPAAEPSASASAPAAVPAAVPAAEPSAAEPSASAAQPHVSIPSFIKQSTILHIGSETFNLFLQTSLVNKGAVGLLSMDDFVERFCRATINTKEVIEAFVKYWTVDGTYKTRSKSDPQPGSNIFRTPCAELDGNILKDAFTKYLGFIEDQIKRYGTPQTPSDIQSKWLLQKDYVKSYLAALTRPIDEKTCINGECARSSNDLYFSVLPKIFYLMYTNSKEKKPLVMSDIFKAFPDLSEDAKDYLEKLLDNPAGTVEAEPELYNLSMGIVQTFYMLPKLFPDVWGHLPSEEEVNKMKKGALTETSVTIDDILKDTTVPEQFKKNILAATEAYNTRDNEAFLSEIRKLFITIQEQIDGLKSTKNGDSDEVAKLKAQLAISSGSIVATLTAERDSLLTRLADLTSEAERTKVLNETHMKMLDSYIKELLAQKGDSSELTRAREELDAAKAGKAVSEEQLRAEYNRQIATLTALNATTADEVERLKAALAAKDVERTAALDAERLAQANALDAARRAQAEALEAARLAHAAQVAALQDARDANDQALANANQALAAAKAAQVAAQTKSTLSESEKAAIEQRLRDAEAAQAEAKKEAQAAKAAQDAAQKEADAAKAAAKAAQKDAEAAKAAAQAAEKKAADDRAAAEAAVALAQRNAAEAVAQAAAQAAAAASKSQGNLGTAQAAAEQKLRDALAAQAAAEASLKAASDAQIHALRDQLDDAQQEKDTLYMDISEHLRNLMTGLSKAVPDLKLPFELQNTLNTHISEHALEPELTEGLATLEQPNIISFDEEVAIVQEYLTKLNDKYSNWESAFESGVKEAPKEAPSVLPKLQKPFTESDKEQIINQINTLILEKKSGRGNPKAIYIVNENGIQVTKEKVGLGNSIIERWQESGVTSTISRVLVKSKDESPIYYFNRLIPYISELSLGKTNIDVERARRLIVSLFKMAYLYIDTLVCSNNDFCAGYYIDAIYTLFNEIPGNKARIMEQLFGSNKNLVKQIFYVYVNYHAADDNETNFWRNAKADGNPETSYTPTKTPTSFYTIQWNEKESQQYFIKHMNKKVFTGDTREGPIQLAASGVPINAKFSKTTGQYSTDELLAAQKAATVKKGGSRFKPYDLSHVLAEQSVWDDMAKAYNGMSPYHKSILGPLESAPVEELKEPMKRFISKNADPDALEEARDAVGLLSPAELEECFHGSSSTADRIMTFYSAAIGNLNKEWLYPLMLSDIIETLDQE